jgi:hypothetical protein
MLSDPTLAVDVYALLIEARGLLANSVAGIKGRCSDQEYMGYRRAIGEVLDVLTVEVLEPIRAAHPSVDFPN